MDTKRIDFIDTFRGIGIILMVMGHIGFGEKFDMFIHSFHMPMFFVISGYFFRPEKLKSLKDTIFKKSITLLVPYFIWGGVHYVIWLFFNEFSLSPLLHLLTINTNGLPIAGALWFLTALFFCDILFCILHKHIHNRVLFWLSVIAISIVGTMETIIFPIRLPLALGPAFVGVGLYGFGYLLSTLHLFDRTERFIKEKYAIVILIIAFALLVPLICLNGEINMKDGAYSNRILFWIVSLCATTIGLITSQYLDFRFRNNLTFLNSIGNHSMAFVCLNQLVIFFAESFIPNGIYSNWFVRGLFLICLLVMLNSFAVFVYSRNVGFIFGAKNHRSQSIASQHQKELENHGCEECNIE